MVDELIRQTTPDEDKSLDAYFRLKERIDKVQDNRPGSIFFDEVEKILIEVKARWSFNKLISYYELKNKVLKHNIKSYALENFQEFNQKNYKIIRDGVITIGGLTNTGKTSFLTALILDILKKNEDTGALFYTLDDSIEISIKRILSQLLKKNIFDYENLEAIEKYFDNDIDNILKKIFTLDKFDIKDFETNIIHLKNSFKNVIVAIDYIQKIPVESEIKREGLNDILSRLKDTQKKYTPGCVLFLISQLSRDDKSLYRYRETSEIENISDVCFLVDYIDDNFKSLDRKISVIKNKLGLKHDFEYTILEDFNFIKTTGGLYD